MSDWSALTSRYRAQVYRLKKELPLALADLQEAVQIENTILEANGASAGSASYKAHQEVLKQAHMQLSLVYGYASKTA